MVLKKILKKINKGPKKIKKAPAKKKKAAKPVKKTVKKAVVKVVKVKKPINRNECPECGSNNVVISNMTGNTICQDCGAIFAGLMPEVENKFQEVKQQR